MDFNIAKEYLINLLKIKSVESESKDGMPFGEGVNECLLYALDILKKEGFEIKNGNGYYGYGEGNKEISRRLLKGKHGQGKSKLFRTLLGGRNDGFVTRVYAVKAAKRHDTGAV